MHVHALYILLCVCGWVCRLVFTQVCVFVHVCVIVCTLVCYCNRQQRVPPSTDVISLRRGNKHINMYIPTQVNGCLALQFHGQDWCLLRCTRNNSPSSLPICWREKWGSELLSSCMIDRWIDTQNELSHTKGHIQRRRRVKKLKWMLGGRQMIRTSWGEVFHIQIHWQGKSIGWVEWWCFGENHLENWFTL